MRKEDEAQAQYVLVQWEGKSNRLFAVFPYMKGITECLQWAFNKHDTRLYSKAGYTVKNIVDSPKTHLKI